MPDDAPLLEHVACNLCGTDDYRVVYPARYERAPHEDLASVFRSSGDEVLIDQLVRCKACGLQYLNPRLLRDLIVDGYRRGTDEAFVSQNHARERTSDGCLATIEARAGIRRGQLVDVGTAAGAFLAAARKRGWTVAGCELNEWLCRQAEEQYGLTVVPGTIFDMKLDRESVDLVTLWDVLEHTTDPAAILPECHRALRPGGVIAINYPDIGSLVARLMGRRWVFLLSVHLYYYTAATMARLLETRGFEPFFSRPHWQTLELGYILTRAGAYAPGLVAPVKRLVRLLGMDQVQIPYWMGQTLVLARKPRAVAGSAGSERGRE